MNRQYTQYFIKSLPKASQSFWMMFTIFLLGIFLALIFEFYLTIPSSILALGFAESSAHAIRAIFIAMCLSGINCYLHMNNIRNKIKMSIPVSMVMLLIISYYIYMDISITLSHYILFFIFLSLIIIDYLFMLEIIELRKENPDVLRMTEVYQLD